MNQVILLKETKKQMFLDVNTYFRIQSHITGLGIDEKDGNIKRIGGGMAYQNYQRSKANVLLNILKDKTLERRFALIHGPISSGKTALSKAIILESGCSNNNVVLLKSELEDPTRDQLQTLKQALRKVLKVRIAEENYVIKGEVVKLSFDEPAPGESDSVGSIILQTRHMTSIYGLGNKMIEQLKKMRIEKGDIILIESATGIVLYLGQTDPTKIASYLPCPNGELAVSRPIYHEVSLHQIDVYNNLFSPEKESKQLRYVEIREELLTLVNFNVAKWLEEGKAELIRGIVLIENLELLKLSCFMYLQNAEHEFLPYVIMNYPSTCLEVLPFSNEFLKDVYKIATASHTNIAIKAILAIRCEFENITLGEKSLRQLKKYASVNLQFAAQILNMISSLCEQLRTIPDLEELYAGTNIVLVTDEFMQRLKEKHVKLEWNCVVNYENKKTVLKLLIQSNCPENYV